MCKILYELSYEPLQEHEMLIRMLKMYATYLGNWIFELKKEWWNWDSTSYL